MVSSISIKMNTITGLRTTRDELHASVFEAMQILKTVHNNTTITPFIVEEVNEWYDESEMFVYNQLKNANKNLDTILDECMNGETDDKVDEWRAIRDEGVEMTLKYMDAFREELHGATDSKTVDIYKVKASMSRIAETHLDAKLDECLS